MVKGTSIHRAESPFYALIAARGSILGACGDGAVLTWAPSEPDRIRLFARAPAAIFALAAPESDVLAIGTQAGELILLHMTERRPLFNVMASQGAIHSIASLTGGRMATGGADGSLIIWERDREWALSEARRIPLLDGKLRALVPAPDGSHLATAGSDGHIRLLDAGLFNETATWNGHQGGTTALAFHPTKPVLLSGGKDGHIRVWDLRRSGDELLSIAAHRSTVYALAFDASGRVLISASRDKTVKRWRAHDLTGIERLDAASGGHTHSVNALCTLGGDVFSAGDDRRLIRWSAAQSG